MDDCFGTTPKQEAIMLLNARGYKLMPVEGKDPILKQWTQLQESRINYLHTGNYGIVLQKEDLVIDVDPRNYAEGQDSLRNLFRDVPSLPLAIKNTLTVKTGGGGYHFYLTKPGDIRVVSELKKQYPGVEFKSAGRFVVGPYSIHPETKKEYQTPDIQKERSEAPQELLSLIQKKAPILEKGVHSPSDHVEYAKRFIGYLETCEKAVAGAGGDATTYNIACVGRDWGLSETSVYMLMATHWNDYCEPAWSSDELLTKVRNAFSYATGPLGGNTPEAQFDKLEEELLEEKLVWDRTTEGKLKKTLINVVSHLKNEKNKETICLRYNTFSNVIEFLKKAPWHTETPNTYWAERDTVLCKYYLAKELNFEVPVALIQEGAAVVSYQNKYHPVRECIERLSWDGVKRLDTWLSYYCGATNNLYTNAIGRKVLVAAITRVFKPGCKFDNVLVLEGVQRIGKSWVCSVLGGEWYADFNVDPANKDTVSLLAGKWIVEMSEMVCNKKSEVDAMKAFISRQSDRVRLPYARTADDFPRQCIFIGTINPEENMGYLRDQTGNRRFWPIEIREVQFEAFKQDVFQIWAEAYEAYKNGESLLLQDVSIERLALAEADKRRITDPWVSRIEQALAELGSDDTVFIEDLWTEILHGHINRYTVKEKTRLTSVMRDLGWVGRTMYDAKRKSSNYGYVRGINV